MVWAVKIYCFGTGEPEMKNLCFWSDIVNSFFFRTIEPIKESQDDENENENDKQDNEEYLLVSFKIFSC